MKKALIPFFILLMISCAPSRLWAQDITSNPGAYMTAISTSQTAMNKSYMAYISASAHSSRKRKIEKMRDQAVESILTCQSDINYMPPYKGDNSLRQASLDYVKLCYKIFNDDYAHIVNMDDIQERSYDEMQAYLLLQQATNDTLQAAISRMSKAEDRFAVKYNVTVTKQETELGDKLAKSDRLGAYRNKVYLLFYKCNWEDNQLTEAINGKNVTRIEQTRNALDKYAIEGLAVLDTLHGFEDDLSLAETCRQALTFYKDEAENQIPGVTNFFLKQEEFDKLKTAMDAKAADQRTQQDVNTYNKAVSDLNASVNTYNQTNASLNSGRNDVNKNWEDSEKTFLDKHTPYYK